MRKSVPKTEQQSSTVYGLRLLHNLEFVDKFKRVCLSISTFTYCIIII